MTKDEYKEMLKDILNNGAEYEWKTTRSVANTVWEPFDITDGYNQYYEYRKKISKNWKVYRALSTQQYYKTDGPRVLDTEKCFFEGTEEECDKWIEEQSKHILRSFKNCDELIACWLDKEAYICSHRDYNPKLQMPVIWIKDKKNGHEHQITSYDRNTGCPECIEFNGEWEDLGFLFEYYTFLDGSPCGVEE